MLYRLGAIFFGLTLLVTGCGDNTVLPAEDMAARADSGPGADSGPVNCAGTGGQCVAGDSCAKGSGFINGSYGCNVPSMVCCLPTCGSATENFACCTSNSVSRPACQNGLLRCADGTTECTPDM